MAPRASSDVVDNHHMSLRRFTGMKRLCAIVDFIFSPLRAAFGLGSPKQFSLLIVCSGAEVTPWRGVIPHKTKQEKKTMSNSSVLEGCSESCIVPPPHREHRRPRAEQPWQEQGLGQAQGQGQHLGTRWE